ncbi:hypothetical protein Q1695_007778 [Nippostrongylus brasiliensis]|nr:hypothetical protein Q1695_007778 [Nippostrongylus brasiliensis]
MISLIGLSCNWFLSFCICRIKSMSNPFGRLVISQATGEAIHLSLILLYFCPMVFFDIKSMKEYSHYCGVLLIACFELAVYMHTLVSINRFLAICFPFYYLRIFTTTITVSLVIGTWLVAVVPSVVIYGFGDCRFQYCDDYYRFGLAYTENCPQIPFPTNVPTFASLAAVIIILDFVTFYRLRAFNKEVIIRQYKLHTWNRARRVEEVRFFKQAFIRAIMFTLAIILYYGLPYNDMHTSLKFIFSTITWVTVLTLDGLFVIVYNRELRSIFCRRTIVSWASCEEILLR